MKKFTSILLTICLLFGVVALFAGCKTPSFLKKKIDSGTEAAKLLLANERLDEGFIGQKIDIGMNLVDVKDASKVVLSSSHMPSSRGIVPLSNSRDVSNPEHTWSSFAQNYSMSMIEFSQFMTSVEHEAGYVAEDIAKMKNNVGVVDKWVNLLNGEKQMLRVFESADMLLTADKDENVHVYYRYTSDNAKNVYEMYSFMNYDDGNTGKIRTLLIPGERCEYFFEDSLGFNDYFIAENSRGFWLATRFSYNDFDGYKNSSFYTYAVKDGLGFGCNTFLSTDLPRGEKTYTIFDPINNRDYFSVTESDYFYSFGLNTSAISSGLNSITGNVTHYDEAEDIYFTNDITSINTSMGDIFASERHEEADGFCLESFSDIRYDYGEQVYSANLTFSMQNPTISIEEASRELLDHLAKIGINTYCEADSLASALNHASMLSDEFSEVFEWNGYTLNNLSNVELARNTLLNQYSNARSEYESVKDFETVSSLQMLSSDAHFASINITTLGENTFDGTVINISGLGATTSDTALFENGLEYVLKIGLSLVDENGNPISVNTVPLAGSEPSAVSFGGGSITISQSGTYNLPKNLDSGEYCLVAYIATKDDGIRVSEMSKVAFLEIYEGEIESSAMHIETQNVGGYLHVNYEIKNSHTLELESTKDAYSYNEIRKRIMVEILSYGAPYSGAELEYENGEVIPSGSPLGVGTYRMMCYLATSDGLAQSYVYLTIK